MLKTLLTFSSTRATIFHMDRLIKVLRALQKRDKLTNKEMALRLGYKHPQDWLRVIRTKKFGNALLQNARKSFPETALAIDIFLSGNTTNFHIGASK